MKKLSHYEKNVCDALRDLVSFAHLKNVKNTHGGVLHLVKLQDGSFSSVSNCTNGTKLRRASHKKTKHYLQLTVAWSFLK